MILREVDSLDPMLALLKVTEVFWIHQPNQEFVDFSVFSIDYLEKKRKAAIVIL